MATSGEEHERLLHECADAYRAMYVRQGVAEEYIEDIIVQVMGSLGSAPVIALRSALEQVRNMS